MLRDYEITKFLDTEQEQNKESTKESVKKYDELKKYENQVYSGMKVGGEHYWNYNDGKWYEIKNSPDKWKFTFNCIKNRAYDAPPNSGAQVGTKYHWFIIADQIAEKLNANSYMTTMKGVKYKIGHKREYWKKFSYEYSEQKRYKEQVIQVLEETLAQLKKE
jgi:hypothetical protein